MELDKGKKNKLVGVLIKFPLYLYTCLYLNTFLFKPSVKCKIKHQLETVKMEQIQERVLTSMTKSRETVTHDKRFRTAVVRSFIKTVSLWPTAYKLLWPVLLKAQSELGCHSWTDNNHCFVAELFLSS